MWFGVAIYAVLAWRHGRPYGVGRAPMTRAAMVNLLRLAQPTAIQQVLFAGGYTTLFWIIGKIGTDELAAANVLINLTMVALLPGMGLGMAGASLVGQALGRGQPDDARRWGWEVAGVACAAMMLLGVPMVLAPEMILGWFVPDEPVAIALAAWPLRLVGGMIFLDAIGMTLMNALLGAGAVRQVSLISVGLQWGLALPLCYLVGPGTGGGLMAVWSVQVAQRALLAVAMSWVWWRGSWAGLRV
jgi:Na+-driven multidrug efflux pump